MLQDTSGPLWTLRDFTGTCGTLPVDKDSSGFGLLRTLMDPSASCGTLPVDTNPSGYLWIPQDAF